MAQDSPPRLNPKLPMGFPRFSHRWRWLIYLCARLYGLVQWIFHMGYDRGWWPIYVCPIPVLSVGGLEVGGSGKTPVTLWLIQTLQQQSFKVGLLSRGYGRASSQTVLLEQFQADASALIGDEPALILQRAPGVVVASGQHRIAGAKALMAAGCEVIVMDDGFAHRRLHRICDIVVLRAQAPLGPHPALLPLGTLRESPVGLARASLVWWHAKSPAHLHHATQVLEQPHKALGIRCDVLSQLHCPTARCLSSHQAISLQGIRVAVICGVAWPHDVVQLAQTLGAQVVAQRFFPDHHAYTSNDISQLVQWAGQHQAEAVVCTEKDGVKWCGLWPHHQMPAWTLPLELSIVRGAEHVKCQLERCLASH